MYNAGSTKCLRRYLFVRTGECNLIFKLSERDFLSRVCRTETRKNLISPRLFSSPSITEFLNSCGSTRPCMCLQNGKKIYSMTETKDRIKRMNNIILILSVSPYCCTSRYFELCYYTWNSVFMRSFFYPSREIELDRDKNYCKHSIL